MYKLTPAAYIWTHGYLRTIQVGIQSAHVVAELFVNYQAHTARADEDDSLTYQWADAYKTIRLLNGGTGTMFEENFNEFQILCNTHNLEHAWFKEPDLNNIVTGFGLILDPVNIADIEMQRQVLLSRGFVESDREMDASPLIQFLKRCRSAD